MRRALALLSAAVLAGLGLLLGAGPAAAHDTLLRSDPPEGSSLAATPDRVALTFSGTVGAGFSTVTVTGPDGAQWQGGAATEDGPVVTAPVRPLGPAGEYVIGYRVVSSDGHPISGSVRFTLTAPGPGAAPTPAPDGSAAPQSPAAPAGGGGDDDAEQAAPDPAAAQSGTPVWPFVVGAVVLLALGAVVALRVARVR